jgi:hypothetical protein
MTSSTQRVATIFQQLERKFTAVPTLKLSSILRAAAVGLPVFTEALEARSRALGVTTLPGQTLLHLLSLYQQHVSSDLASSIIWHQPSVTAGEKAALLNGHLVQKSITVQFEDALVLCSGIGDFRLSHALLREIARARGLKKRVHKHLQINPLEFPPEYLYGMLEGMVSPFLPPGRMPCLDAVVFLAPPMASVDRNKQVAISISPFESLLVPFSSFQALLYAYADTTYPDKWTEIPVEQDVGLPAERETVLV